MIQTEPGRGRPCVLPGAGSRTEGERAWQHLGGRKAGGGSRGTPPPHSTASSRRWPGRDCMVRAGRRVPPAARLLPCRGLRAPVDSWGRWRRSRDVPCSAPPPRSRTLSPTSGEHGTARGGDHRGLTAAGWLPSPAPPGHLLLMPAGRPRPGPAPSGPGAVGGPPSHALLASPPTAPRARPFPRRPLAPPGAGSQGSLTNRRPGGDGGGANANHAALGTRAGSPRQKSLPSSLPAPWVQDSLL